MSASKLVMSFATLDGQTVILSYNYAKSDLTAPFVKALTQGIVTNGSIFATVPAIPKSAKIVTTTENAYDLDD